MLQTILTIVGALTCGIGFATLASKLLFKPKVKLGKHPVVTNMPLSMRLRAAWAVFRHEQFFLVTSKLTAAACNPEHMIKAHKALESAMGDMADELEKEFPKPKPRQDDANLADVQWSITKSEKGEK